MKILVDVNLAPSWVKRLEDAGFDAMRWTSIGPANADDATISAYADREGYVVLTHDQDFSTLLAYTRRGGPSVVLLRTSSLRPDRFGERVVRALEIARSSLEARPGAVLVIEDQRVRLRRLPIGPRAPRRTS